MKRCILLLLFLQAFALHAQTDSLPWSRNVNLREGIFLSFQAFRTNRPIPIAQLITTADREAPDFMAKTTAARTITWRDSAGVQHDTVSDALWGYCYNRHVYIRVQNAYTRIMVVGTLSHFSTTETNYLYTGGPGPGGNAPVRQQMQYVLDTYTGSIAAFTPQFMLAFLEQHDKSLAAEFKHLSKRKRNQQLFIFLRRFNTAHPLKFE